jgi:hypothetical protein
MDLLVAILLAMIKQAIMNYSIDFLGHLLPIMLYFERLSKLGFDCHCYVSLEKNVTAMIV